jgi:hypothetical protein
VIGFRQPLGRNRRSYGTEPLPTAQEALQQPMGGQSLMRSTATDEFRSKSWRRIFYTSVIATVLPALVVFLFVAIIDPWDALPLSPQMPRQPVTTSARYAFAMLARSASFDSAVIGTSTTRLLRPAGLDQLLMRDLSICLLMPLRLTKRHVCWTYSCKRTLIHVLSS